MMTVITKRNGGGKLRWHEQTSYTVYRTYSSIMREKNLVDCSPGDSFVVYFGFYLVRVCTRYTAFGKTSDLS
jgi:hypothetical protein